MSKQFHLMLFPGLGADGRLFEAQRAEFPGLEVPPWLDPLEEETLPEYAARLAETVEVKRPLVLGGVSFGGMIACELSVHLKPDALVLVASCRSPEAIRFFYRALQPLIGLVPRGVARIVKPFSPLIVHKFGTLTREQTTLFVQMVREADAEFIHWGAHALLKWQPSPLPDVPVYHIHGARDQIIPAGKVEADELVGGGGHLINVTHADAVNAFIRRAATPAIDSAGK